MINYHSTLVTELKTLNKPVYYETFDGAKQLPCITYFEIGNVDYANGDTLSYSELAFQIKVWGKTVGEVLSLAADIDNLLKPLGFIRSFAGDSVDGVLSVKTMRYNAIGVER